MEVQRFVLSNNGPETDYTKDLDESLRRWTQRVFEILSGGLRVDENMDVAIKSATTDATPGNETAIAHGLGRVPSGYIVISKDKAAHIYDGTTAIDSTNIYIRSDVASVAVKVLIL